MKSLILFLFLPLLFLSCSGNSEDKIKNAKPVKLEFFEVYTKSEMVYSWTAILKWIDSNEVQLNERKITPPNFDILLRNFGNDFVFDGTVENLRKIEKFFEIEEIKSLLPKDVKFIYSKKGENVSQGKILYQLYAIKVPENGEATINGKHIKEAIQEFDQHTKSPIITIKMTDEGAHIWSEMTAKNISQSIAICLDGVVISCPNVMTSITDGITQVSGAFSIEEAQELAAGINAGR